MEKYISIVLEKNKESEKKKKYLYLIQEKIFQ